MRTFILLLQVSLLTFFLVFITACTSNNKSGTMETNQSASVDQGHDEATKTVFEFLNWYKTNMSRLSRIELVTNNGYDGSDSTKLYAVNFKGTEEYLRELLNSQFISEKYAAKQREYFKLCETNFKSEPQYEGPPLGFDFDLIMLSQDFDLDQLSQVKTISHKGTDNTNHVILEFPYNYKLAYSLSYVNGKWLIDDIQNITKP